MEGRHTAITSIEPSTRLTSMMKSQSGKYSARFTMYTKPNRLSFSQKLKAIPESAKSSFNDGKSVTGKGSVNLGASALQS